MAKDTKIRLLESALEVFAREGYERANIKDIADNIGLVKSAVYKHFESKEAIWNAVIAMMKEYYENNFANEERAHYSPKSTNELYEMTVNMVNFTIHDKKVIAIRKIFTIEQYRSEEIRDYASNYFLYITEDRFTRIFETMMDNGVIKRVDPRILAFSYTTPITALIHLCDRDPQREKEAFERLEAFVKLFIQEYGIK